MTSDISPHDMAARHDPVYDELHASPEFTELKRRYRGFVFPATLAFLSWYLLYVVLSNWAGDFMSKQVVGNVNVAWCSGCCSSPRPSSSPGSTRATPAPASTRWPASSTRGTSPTRGVSADGPPAAHHPAVPRRRRTHPRDHDLASRQTSGTADFYAGGRSFSGIQNGFAIGGDYMSAASFLGISGAIALSGYDGFLYSIGFLVAWLVALLLVAEMLRNSAGTRWPTSWRTG